LVASAPRLPAASFDKMFNAQVQDMLAVVYLANLTRTQLVLAEKLQAVAISAAH
jgi:translation initiation factor 3 subunit F